MSVPEKMDKWIVLTLMLGVGIVYLLRSTVPGGFSVVDWIAIPTIFAVVLTVFHMIWCACCRGIARVFRAAPTSANVRLFANVGFLIVMLALILVPYQRTVTIPMPIEHRVQTR
jgi:hypothetical protein